MLIRLKYLHILFLFILEVSNSFAQNTIGFPDVTRYSWQDYKAGLQNWDIRQDNSGIIYFANNEGLLVFDGMYWDLYSLPHRTIARSIDTDNHGRIYIGGQDEMGYFTTETAGTLKYVDMTVKIPASGRTFGDVWDVVCTGNEVYFRTNDKIFKFHNGAFSIFKAPSEWNYLGVISQKIYAQDRVKGLMYLSGDNWIPENSFNTIAGTNCIITGSLDIGRKTIVSTLKNGFFHLDEKGTKPLLQPELLGISQNRVYCISRANNSQIAVGTSNGGAYIIDTSGAIVQHFSIKEGLQNNNVLSIFTDKKGNIWLGLDNGTDCVAYNSPIKHILADDQESSGYTAIIRDNKLFIGTSSGLYETTIQKTGDISFSKGVFRSVTGSSGQVWGLSNLQGNLFMGHHEGLFAVSESQATNIVKGDGYWNLVPMNDNPSQNSIAGGYYKGIRFFSLSNGQLLPQKAVSGFDESSRYMVSDAEGNLWVSHPYHGVFKILPEAGGDMSNIKKIGSDKGLPGPLNNFIFKIRNQIVAATEKGVFSYNRNTQTFSADSFYTRLLGNTSIRYLKEDTEGNIWFIHEKKLGVIDISGNNVSVHYLSDLDNRMLSGFEFMLPLNASNLLLGGEKGFYHINYQKYKSLNSKPGIRLHKVKIFNTRDSTVFGGFEIQKTNQDLSYIKLDHAWRNIHFEFSAPEFGMKSKMQFSFFLKGYDYGWSDWSEKTEKDYTNLSPGNYTFQVKSRNNLGTESAVATYRFTIIAPWYRSYWAYLVYLLIITYLMSSFYLRQKRKLKIQRMKHLEEQRKTNYLYQLEKDKAESELVTLRNEKLQSEIEFKNSELANSAMHLLQKGELLARLKAELSSMMKKVQDEQSMNEIKKMIRALTDDENMDQEWEHFAQHFDKVHSDYTQILMDIHPNITPNDVKLCTYLKMNLSSKEISRLMNISVRGVELSRYRLRKKMGLTTETNLVDYLMKLGKKKGDSNNAISNES